MKFFTQEGYSNASTMFGVIVAETEYYAKSENSKYINVMIHSIMNRLSMMIAAYYFKKHKDEYIEWLSSDDCKQRIAQELVARIKIDLSLQ